MVLCRQCRAGVGIEIAEIQDPDTNPAETAESIDLDTLEDPTILETYESYDGDTVINPDRA